MLAAATFALLMAGGMIKGVIGIGLPVIAIPVLTLLIGLPQAVSVVTLPLIAANAWQVWQFRHSDDPVRMTSFVVAGGLGIIVGTWVLTTVPAALLEAALGILLLVYLFQRLLQPQLRLSRARARQLAEPVGFAAGVLQGSTGLAGPIGITYFHAMGLSRAEFIRCSGIMFLGFTLVQIVSLQQAGLMTLQALTLGLVALPGTAIGLWIGNAIAGWLPPRFFDRLVLIVLGWTSGSLLWGVGQGWL